MTEDAARRVVVCGVDGSTGSRYALQEAIRSAVRRGARVQAVAAYEPPEMWAAMSWGAAGDLPIPDAATLHREALKLAQGLVDEVASGMAAELTLPEITVEARPGRAAEELVDIARRADELVVGHRGRGAFGSVVLGSVGLGCVLHATCPITVVPEPTVTGT
ncbi:universal stress protein [Actinomycetospora cinnamomea]|uniref:Nucleotide-binding universal stress UspA family protein n=1 Tax=Actinomycetospora cinnamomea TaxID=663609 RepID=A0A2U1F262_9PSEU|nr:universal stress protein [Actinomycetospora cinnamomea]PVZ06274.1 nucleotide-binding universal stress UspA family protein [Actinomycetospora cinnamomea]